MKYLLYVKAGLIYIVANNKNESLLLKVFHGSLLKKCALEKRPCVYWYYRRLIFGEGNGTPLQSSCPENPVDGGAR